MEILFCYLPVAGIVWLWWFYWYEDQPVAGGVANSIIMALIWPAAVSILIISAIRHSGRRPPLARTDRRRR